MQEMEATHTDPTPHANPDHRIELYEIFSENHFNNECHIFIFCRIVTDANHISASILIIIINIIIISITSAAASANASLMMMVTSIRFDKKKIH